MYPGTFLQVTEVAGSWWASVESQALASVAPLAQSKEAMEKVKEALMHSSQLGLVCLDVVQASAISTLSQPRLSIVSPASMLGVSENSFVWRDRWITSPWWHTA